SITGTRPSVRNGQLLVSTGLPALDQLLGGGLAVGTVLLIEEDKYNIYSPLLFKYFLAEGIVNGHTLLVASAKEDPANILQIKKELFLVSLLIRVLLCHPGWSAVAQSWLTAAPASRTQIFPPQPPK
ncbi:LOW QUALITY PROTEIN: ELP4 isoform 15, partial [Pan troglodytes]